MLVSLHLCLNHQSLSFSKLHQEEGLFGSQVFDTVSVQALLEKAFDLLFPLLLCVYHSESAFVFGSVTVFAVENEDDLLCVLFFSKVAQVE